MKKILIGITLFFVVTICCISTVAFGFWLFEAKLSKTQDVSLVVFLSAIIGFIAATATFNEEKLTNG